MWNFHEERQPMAWVYACGVAQKVCSILQHPAPSFPLRLMVGLVAVSCQLQNAAKKEGDDECRRSDIGREGVDGSGMEHEQVRSSHRGDIKRTSPATTGWEGKERGGRKVY